MADKSIYRMRLWYQNCLECALELHIPGEKRKGLDLGLTLPQDDPRVLQGPQIKANSLSR